MKLKIMSALLSFAIIITLTACGNKSTEKENDQTISAPNAESSITESESDIPSADTESSDTESSAETSETPSTEPTTEPKKESTNKSEGTKNGQSQTQIPQTSQPTPQTTESSHPDTPPPETVKNASSADAEAIANKTLEYINQYRIAQGAGAATKLPGLTKVAQYRSNQLVSNYKHDNVALREAATANKYGEHIVIEETRWDAATQSVIKTGNILDYYDAGCGEAIGRSGGNATVDVIAERMAIGFKNSTNHWSYVGAARTKYIAIGATFGNGQWYIAILTSETNTYN